MESEAAGVELLMEGRSSTNGEVILDVPDLTLLQIETYCSGQRGFLLLITSQWGVARDSS